MSNKWFLFQDTVLGLQAMSEYGAMFSEPLNLDVDISSGSFHKQIHVGQNDAMVLKLVDVRPRVVLIVLHCVLFYWLY